MVGELGRIFRTDRRRRHLGAAGRRHEAAVPRHELPRRQDRMDRRQGRHRLCHAVTAATPGRQLKTGSQRHIFALEFPNAAARARRRRLRHAWSTRRTAEPTWTTSRIPEDVKLPESALDTGVEPGDVNLYGLSYGDPDHAWVAGEFGIIAGSTDGGLTWKQQTTPIESTLFGIRFTDAQRGFAVGLDSVILAHRGRRRHLDASSRAPIAGRSLYDVFVRGQQGWIVGDQGTVLKTRRRRRHLAARAAAHPARRQLDPLRVARAGAARSRRRLRRTGLPHRRRQH